MIFFLGRSMENAQEFVIKNPDRFRSILVENRKIRLKNAKVQF